MDEAGIHDKLNRILSYIENDEKTGRKGLFTECAEMRRDLDGLLEREKIYMAKVGIIGSIFGAIGAGIVWAFKIFLK